MYETKYPGVFQDKSRIYTINSGKGSVYEERLLRIGNTEYRNWDAKRSKLAAAILKGIRSTGISKSDVVLYLGSATGTTASHVSDLVPDGFVFALDFAPRVVRDIVFVCQDRKNITPILADANHPEEYVSRVCAVDAIYMDVAQKNQVEIFLKNVKLFLKKGGYCLLALKARSIDVTKRPRDVYKKVEAELTVNLDIIDEIGLDPYQKDHCMFLCRKR